VISRWIDWCARNGFLVLAGTLLLVLVGIWSLRQIPLDALPDISDVQVIIHTPWAGHLPHRHNFTRGSACEVRSGANHVW
jgi:Cu(I)/Ag(I) efflux system membrane protein CusA/SilA